MNNYVIEKTDKISLDMITQIDNLCSLCDGYEPYYDTDGDSNFVHITAFDDNKQLIGFMGGIISDNAIEITGLVHPDYRKQGVFKKMLDILHLFFEDTTILGAIPLMWQSPLKTSSIGAEYTYSEVLMQLCNNNYKKHYDNYCPDTKDICSNSYEFFFSDEYDNFLMYAPDKEEPIAVCNLDFFETFTNISGVFVDEDMRNKGIGTQFIKALTKAYFDEFDKPLSLHVTDKNIPAVKLYEKCGFKAVEHVDYYIM